VAIKAPQNWLNSS